MPSQKTKGKRKAKTHFHPRVSRRISRWVDHYDFSNLWLFIDDSDAYNWKSFVTPFGRDKPFSAYSEEPLSVSFNTVEPPSDNCHMVHHTLSSTSPLFT